MPNCPAALELKMALFGEVAVSERVMDWMFHWPAPNWVLKEVTGAGEVELQDALELAFGQARSGHGERAGAAVVIAAEVAGRAGGDEGVGGGIEGEGGGVSREPEEQAERGGRKRLLARSIRGCLHSIYKVKYNGMRRKTQPNKVDVCGTVTRAWCGGRRTARLPRPAATCR